MDEMNLARLMMVKNSACRSSPISALGIELPSDSPLLPDSHSHLLLCPLRYCFIFLLSLITKHPKHS